MIQAHRRCLGALAVALVGACAQTSKPCVLNSDCPKGRYCDNGLCRLNCRQDFDCAGGAVCDKQLGMCVPAGTDLAMPSDDLGNAAPVDLSMPSTMPDLTTASASLAYGDVCQHGTQCSTGHCIASPFDSQVTECTGPCGAGCRLGDECIPSINECGPSDVGNGCNGVGANCLTGLCLAPPNLPSQSFCTASCTSAAGCPAGYACSPVPTQSGTVKLCVAVDKTSTCQHASDCWYGTVCAGAGATGVCYATCATNADCPLDNTCTMVPGTTTSVCLNGSSSGSGGIGASCAQGTDCRSGLCAMGMCVEHCGVTKTVGQWCPPGWGCNPIGDGNGGWTDVCLRAGAGPLGASCTDNTGCNSGLCAGNTCTTFCNDAPCPNVVPHCESVGITADGIAIEACGK